MLLKRVLVAVIAVPPLLCFLIYAGAWANLALFTGLAGVCLFEYLAMAFSEDKTARGVLLALGIALYLAWGASLVSGASPTLANGALVATFLLGFLFFLFRPGDLATVAPRTALGLFGIFYINMTLIFLTGLHNLTIEGAPNSGWRYVILLLAIIWLNDTGGYFAGKALGRRKFYALVSPKKTWEGSIGGALLGTAGAFACNSLMDLGWTPLQVVAAALLTGYVGQVGDLCESLLKRGFGVKDSGQTLPGHGGFLDRVDAVMFGAPFLFFFIELFIH